jgi:TRAP-type C4-dicarboxylate transport system permease small subunit
VSQPKTIDILEGWTIRFTRIVAFLGLIALLALAAVVLANALMSWVFVAPIDGVVDWIRLIVAIAVGACIPAVLAMRANITVGFVGHIIGPAGTKWLELFGAIATLIVLVLLAWQLQVYVIELFRSGETTENLGMPIGPWWQVVTALFYLSILVQLLVVVSIAHAIASGRPLPDHARPSIDDPGEPA